MQEPPPPEPEIERFNVGAQERTFRVAHMKGDGACIFRAVAHVVYGDQERHPEVRGAIVEHVTQNWPLYSDFVRESTPQEYFAKMSGSCEFGTAIEINAANRLYRVSFEIFINKTQIARFALDAGDPVAYLKFSGPYESGHVDVYELVADEPEKPFNSDIAFENLLDFTVNFTQTQYIALMFKYLHYFKQNEYFESQMQARIQSAAACTPLQKFSEYSAIMVEMNKKYNEMHDAKIFVEELPSDEAADERDEEEALVDYSMDIESLPKAPAKSLSSASATSTSSTAPLNAVASRLLDLDLKSLLDAQSPNCELFNFYVSRPKILDTIMGDINALLNLTTLGDKTVASLKNLTHKLFALGDTEIMVVFEFKDFLKHPELQKFLLNHENIKYKKLLSAKAMKSIVYLEQNPDVILQQPDAVKNILLSILLTYKQASAFNCFLCQSDLNRVSDERVLKIIDEYRRLKYVNTDGPPLAAPKKKKAPIRIQQNIILNSVAAPVIEPDIELGAEPAPPELGAEPDTELGAEPDTELGAEPDTELGAEPAPPELGAEFSPEPDTELGFEPDTEPGADRGAESGPERGRERGAESEFNFESGAELGFVSEGEDSEPRRRSKKRKRKRIAPGAGDEESDYVERAADSDDSFVVKRSKRSQNALRFFDMEADVSEGSERSGSERSLSTERFSDRELTSSSSSSRASPDRASFASSRASPDRTGPSPYYSSPSPSLPPPPRPKKVRPPLRARSPSPVRRPLSPFEPSVFPKRAERRRDDLPSFPSESMPYYFQKLLMTMHREVRDGTRFTAGLGSHPTRLSDLHARSLVGDADLSPLTRDVRFYDMLKPLSLYGATLLDESQILWFINKSYVYFALCADRFETIRRAVGPAAADETVVFVIKYNFLWHYAEFIRTLMSSALTAHPNRKIVNALTIFDSNVRKKFSAVSSRAGLSPPASAVVENTLVKLMQGEV
uniref:Ld-vp80 n=1 Tax=Lymantria dispar multicapsid nuclear polyhedrosis virus TaxID=10449 RepID=A0A513WWE3_NPVLD|nr:Ld-vp80 [Lymantria dispar multiple nucleopolyhedrovirus]